MLRDRLRCATRSQHERIERTLDVPRSITSPQKYVDLLQRLYGFYVPAEAQLLPFRHELNTLGVDVDARLKADKLRADLRCHGMRKEEIDSIGLCPDVPPLDTCMQCLGRLYVLEGATLGGLVIARHLEQKLHFNSQYGMRFYQAYGSDTGRMWRSFVDCINAAPVSDEDSNAITEAARMTFESLERWAARKNG